MRFDAAGALAAGYSKAEIVDHVAQKFRFDATAAREAGYSDDEIIEAFHRRFETHGIPPDAAAPGQHDPAPARMGRLGTPGGVERMEDAAADTLKAVVPGSVQRGYARTMEGVANTAEVLGAEGAAQTVRALVDEDQLNAPSSIDALTQGIRERSVSKVLGNLPGAIGEGVPQLVGTVATSVAGAAAGGAVAGPGGAVAGGFAAPAILGVVTQAGDIAKARAAADGRAEPNDADIAAALGSSAVLGALDRVGLGGAAGGMIANAVKASLGRGAAGRVATAAGSVAAHGAADAAQSIGQNLAVTAGTATGATVDPEQAAAAAITGAATRGTLGAVRRVGDHLDGTAGAERAAARTEDLARRWDAMDPEDQQRARTAAGAGQAVQRVLDTQVGLEPVSYTRAARTAQNDIVGNLARLTSNLKDQGRLTPEGETVIRDATAAARNLSRALTDGDDGAAGHLQAVRGLGLDADTTGRIEAALREVDALSRAGETAGRGPLETAGGWLGHAAGAKAAGSLGASILLFPLLGRGGEAAGAAMGRGLDKAFGLRRPALVKEATRAVDLMTAAGEAVPNTRAELRDSIGRQRGALADLDAQLGLMRNAEDVAADRAKAGTQNARQDATATGRQQAAAEGDGMAPSLGGAAAGVTASADRARVKLDAIEARAVGRAAIRQQAQQGPRRLTEAPAASGGGGDAGAGARPVSDSPSGSGEAQGGTGSGDMARYARRLPEWAYGMVRGAHDDLARSGLPKNLDYQAEARWAIGEALKRGWFDGGDVSAERRAAALRAHEGRFAGPIYTALRNLILERHGVNRLAE